MPRTAAARKLRASPPTQLDLMLDGMRDLTEVKDRQITDLIERVGSQTMALQACYSALKAVRGQQMAPHIRDAVKGAGRQAGMHLGLVWPDE